MIHYTTTKKTNKIYVPWIKTETSKQYQNVSDGIFVVKSFLIKSIYRSTYVECGHRAYIAIV